MTDNSTIELQLLRWNEGPAGRTVTFLLPDEEGPHPFKNLRTGPAHGQRLGAAFALIHDDETTTPVEQADVRSNRTTEPPPQAPARPADGGNGNGAGKRRWEDVPRAQRAGIRCGESEFREFLRDRYQGWIRRDEDGEIDAAASLRVICAIASRRDLDTDKTAGAVFDRLDGEYRAWMAMP